MDASTLLSIARQGNILGQFTLGSVRTGLGTGKFLTTDAYWIKGMPGWEPLTKLPAEAAATPESSPAAESPASPSPAAQGGTPTNPGTTPTQPPTTSTSRPAASAPPPPPIPSSAPRPAANPPGNPVTRSGAIICVGVVLFLYGLLTDPQGSAIRQQVLVQHMTNGLLFVILGVLVKKFD